MFHVLNEMIPNTNNSLEAFNGNLNGAQVGPQTLYTVIKGFRREVEYTEIKHKEIISGKYKEEHAGRKKMKMTRDTDLSSIMAEFNNEKVDQLLKSIINLLAKNNKDV